MKKLTVVQPVRKISHLYGTLKLCEIWGFHSSSVDDSGLLRCDAVLLGVS